MKIGFLGEGFIDWGGGIDLLRMIVSSCIAVDETEECQFFLLLPTRGPRHTYRWIRRLFRRLASGSDASRHLPPKRSFVLEGFVEFADRVVIVETDNGVPALKRAIRHLKLDILIPAIEPLPPDIGAPWIGYLYDFQHKYLPHFFVEEDIQSRDANFATMVEKADALIVNAQAVADDVVKYFPESRARVYALPFSPAPSLSWFRGSDAIRELYCIEKKFFIICNQFWIHKNHKTAFLAFARIASEYPDVMLVCTGQTEDPRAPDNFSELLRILDREGVRERVKILGLVPKLHQIELVRQSLAVIQPTLFEGGPGGGATYDAVAVGTTVILSDIPVNREVVGSSLRFFPPEDVHALAQQLRAMLSAPRAERELPDVLIKAGLERRRRSGEVLMSALKNSAKLT